MFLGQCLSLHSTKVVVGAEGEGALAINGCNGYLDLEVFKLFLLIGADVDEHLLGG